MKTNKFLFILILSLFSVSLASAQGYVDDLYYKRKSKTEREAIEKAERARLAAERAQVKKTARSETEEVEISDEEYYPGMFADMVNGDKANAERTGNGANDDSKSNTKTTIEIVGVWSPSWYSYAGWGGSFYDPFWYGNRFYDPFYRYGWGYNCWSGWNGSYDPCYYGNRWGHGWGNGWYNPHYSYGWNRPYYGHGNYYEPRYNRTNSTIGNGRRDGGTMIGTSSYGRGTGRGNSGNYTVTNQIRRMDNTTRGNSSRPNMNTNNTTNPSQYNRRDTYTPPPTTTNRGSSTGTSGGYNRGGSVGTGSGVGSGSGSGAGSGAGTTTTRRR